MPKKTVHLAVDMMSGDAGLGVTVPAVRHALADYPQLVLHLAGDESDLDRALAPFTEPERARIEILHAPDSVLMGDQPVTVLKNSDASSMRIALEAQACGRVRGVISAGNAGALMILSRKMIGMLKASTRPAFCSLFPTDAGSSLILDLGANVDCSAQQLGSFAVLGSALFSALFSSSSPRVALLSNGVETGKGTRQLKLAAQLLEEMPGINYAGYVEANTLHRGLADIVVCDGFVGNIALKAIEGTADLARESLQKLLSADNAYGTTSGQREQLLADFSGAMDPELHNGAFLLGLAGIVVKAHGHSSVQGFAASIGQALECEEQHMIAKMQEQLTLAARPAR